MPSRRTQDERSEQSRQALQRAAVQLLLKRGYTRLTTTDVAKAAGLSRGALTHHFANKEDLVVRSVADDLSRVTNELRLFIDGRTANHPNPDELLNYLWALMSGGLFYVTLEYLPEARHNPAFRERLLPVVRDFHEALDALWLSVSDAHGIDPAEARTSLNATMCLLRGMVAQSILRPDPAYFDDLLAHWKAHLRAIFASGCAASEGHAAPPPRPLT